MRLDDRARLLRGGRRVEVGEPALEHREVGADVDQWIRRLHHRASSRSRSARSPMNSATWSSAASSLAAIRRRISASSCGSSQALHDLLEVALHQHPHGLGAGDAASHHVEDLVLVELADRPAVGGGHAVGLDDQRRDRVALGLLGEQHLVRLQVGVALLGVRDDVDQPLVRGARVAREGALPDGVAGGVALLVLVGGEQVEVLVALGEVEARCGACPSPARRSRCRASAS